MTETSTEIADEIVAQRDALSQRLTQAMQHTLELFTIYLGDRLGLYQALAAGPLTSHELAARTGTHERYVREWLEQQTAAGIVITTVATDAGAAHRYLLPPGHLDALTDPDSAGYVAPIAQGTVSVVRPIAAVLDAFRTGAGVPFEAYGPDCVEGMARMNRPGFLNLLGTHQLPLIEDVHARLQADPPARIAEIGCGAAWSSIALARAYPKVRIDAFEVDALSVTMARENVEAAALEDRIVIHQRDVRDRVEEANYDLVIAVNCIHDMGDPVTMLRTMRELAGSWGVVIDAEPGVDEHFIGEANTAEAFIYAASVLHCLPVGMSEQPSAATGMAMRPSTLRRYAQDAGFRDIELLPIHFEESGLAFYRMLV